VKKKEDLDEPKVYFERNIPLVATFVGLSALLVWLSIEMLKAVNPWGTLVAVPGIIFAFQSIWFITNPYVIVYDDRFEIKHSFFYGKTIFFLDLKEIKAIKGSRLKVVYNDGDPDQFLLDGIRGSHKAGLQKALEEKLEKSMKERLF